MRRRNREVQVFSLSMLDVMTGALGAVLVIMAVLSTRPESAPDPVDQARLRQLEERVRQLESQVKRLEKRRPVAVQIWWMDEGQDVDLYVKSPDPRDPGPALKKQGPRFPGDVGIDAKGAFGSETWLLRDMPRGAYEIYLKLMTEGAAARTTKVWLYYLYKDSAKSIGRIDLKPSSRLVKVAALNMDAAGNVALSLEPGVEKF